MPVMMPGSAIGSTSSSEIASRPKKLRTRQRRSGQRAEDEVPRPWTSVATCSDRPSASQMSCRSQATANQCSVSPAAETVAALLGGEGVEEDEGQRQMCMNSSPAPAASLEAKRRACCGSERIERPQSRASVRSTPMIRIGTTEKAAASGMFPAVPCWA